MFSRIAALAIAVITLYEPGEPLYVGWVWREPGKPWKRSRAWFAEECTPAENKITSRWFSTQLVDEDWQISQLYDTNIFVPGKKHQVNCDLLAPGVWKSQKKRLNLKIGATKAVAMWFN